MEKLFRGVRRHRVVVLCAFLALTLVNLACIPRVVIDANMSDYLPTSAKSSQDLTLMKGVYGNDIPDARVYVTGISQPEAERFADELKDEDAVVSVSWLGSQVNLDEPMEVQDQDTIRDWYDGDGYLFQAVLSSKADQKLLRELEEEQVEENGRGEG